MHDLVLVGVPLIAILVGILFSRSDIKDLRAEMVARFADVQIRFADVQTRFNEVDARFNSVEARFNKIEDHLSRIDADLRQFYHLTGKLEARMDALDKRG